MKRYLLLFPLVLISNFIFSQSTLDGLWILAYKIDRTPEAERNTGVQYIVDISDDNCQITTFNKPFWGIESEQRSLNISLKNDSVVIYENDPSEAIPLRLITLSKDSFVLSTFDDHQTDLVFKRLPRKAASELPIERNAWVTSTVPHTDTMDFVNQYHFVLYTDSLLAAENERRWKVTKYKGLIFLSFGYVDDPICLVQMATSDSIKLVFYHRNDGIVLLTRVNNDANLKHLKGKWKQKELPSPFPPPPVDFFDSTALEMHLVITDDSIRISRYNHSTVYKWHPSSVGDVIYIYHNLVNQYQPWKVISLTETELVIERAFSKDPYSQMDVNAWYDSYHRGISSLRFARVSSND